MPYEVELVVRILIGTVLGAVIGYERDIHGRPAGLRTHALVALASATFMVVSSQLVYFQHYKAGDLVDIDGSRIAASVVSGIGFLAGGAILRQGLTIQGLTTAAGLWLVAAIGLCAGSGMYTIAVAATVIGVATLTILRVFEDKDEVARRLRLDLAELEPQPLLDRLDANKIEAALVSWTADRAAHTHQVTLSVRLRKADEAKLLALLAAEPAITKMHLEAH